MGEEDPNLPLLLLCSSAPRSTPSLFSLCSSSLPLLLLCTSPPCRLYVTLPSSATSCQVFAPCRTVGDTVSQSEGSICSHSQRGHVPRQSRQETMKKRKKQNDGQILPEILKRLKNKNKNSKQKAQKSCRAAVWCFLCVTTPARRLKMLKK